MNRLECMEWKYPLLMRQDVNTLAPITIIYDSL